MDIRQVTLQAPASNTTQNYTVTDFGTPTAAIILSSRSTSGSWDGTAAILNVGFWDGTDGVVAGMGWLDNSSPGSSDSRHFTDTANVVRTEADGGTSGDRLADITNTVTDGVELTWTGGAVGVRPYVTVILINGINGAKAGHRVLSSGIDTTTATTTTGITPKLILFAGRRSDTAIGGSSSPGFFVGFAAENGSIFDNRSRGCRNLDTDATDCNTHVSDLYCITSDMGTSGNLSGPNELTAVAADSFTTTMRVDSSSIAAHMYLALDFDEEVTVFTATTPTSSGDFTPFSTTFTPQWVFMIPTAETSMNTNNSGGEPSVEECGVYSVIDDGEEDGHYVTFENGSTGANSQVGQSRHDTRLEVNTITSSSPANLLNGNSPTFNASGIVYADANFTHDSAARKLVGFAVSAAAGTPVATMMKMMHEGHLNG